MKILLEQGRWLTIVGKVVELHSEYGKIRELDEYETQFVLKAYETGKQQKK